MTHLRKLIDRTTRYGMGDTAHRLWGHAVYLGDQWQEKRLDRRWGVETTQRVRADLLDGQVAGRGGYDYQGVHPVRFDRLIRALRLHVPSTWAYTFCDVGAGKGRAMMLAAQWPWQRVFGVELSPSLVEAAQENLANYVAKRQPAMPVEVVCADALVAELPAGPVVHFLYNPFGAEVLESFVRRLVPRDDETTDLWVVYCNPVHASVLEEAPWLQAVELQDDWQLWRRRPHRGPLSPDLHPPPATPSR